MTTHLDQAIEKFFASASYGVLGVSTRREKYGNKVLRCYLQHHKTVYPVHLSETVIENTPCLKTIADLPDTVKSISIITPPPITERLVTQAIEKGIAAIWMQPGAESKAAVENAEQHGITVIAGGPCILVVMGFHDN